MRADRTNWGNRKMYKWKKDAKALLFTVNTEGSESRLRWERGEGKQNRKILLDKSSTFTKTVAFFFLEWLEDRPWARVWQSLGFIVYFSRFFRLNICEKYSFI